MNPSPWDPLGDAIQDYQNGDKSSELVVLSDFEVPVTISACKFFRTPDEFPQLEKVALSLCDGLVLDIGAGAGCHVLALQDMGCAVIGVDISRKAIEVMRSRGVKCAFCGDVFSLTTESIDAPDCVDTILMLMNGIGLVGNLGGLRRFFDTASKLLNPHGKLLFDSVDLREFLDRKEILSRESGSDRKYFGEVKYRFNYKGETGSEFSWLYIDPDLLDEVAFESGWRIDAIYPHKDGHYLAQLSIALKN